MKTIRWIGLIVYLIPIRHKHLWMYSVDALFVFAFGYYWKQWGAGK